VSAKSFNDQGMNDQDMKNSAGLLVVLADQLFLLTGWLPLNDISCARAQGCVNAVPSF